MSAVVSKLKNGAAVVNIAKIGLGVVSRFGKSGLMLVIKLLPTALVGNSESKFIKMLSVVSCGMYP